ncbi:50S ribosomal protein L28 [Candidatus Parcubacteria bacterium]|nr:50S ribosomal protein L28 [Candidatus Parcubacteria bacterium]MBI4098991.1 50S ribosomal protein L28 [Candidatus Parcubacteria bacterium]MBI4385352.1 50S ribosomal protein L28 [Candidatus Parcubacteria bacterium]
MARVCTLCGKSPHMSVTRTLLRGKYNPTAKTRKYPNLQWVRIGSGKRVKACTQCIKRMAVTQ